MLHQKNTAQKRQGAELNDGSPVVEKSAQLALYRLGLYTTADMAKKFFKRYLPDAQTVRDHKYLRIFGKLLYDPNLWHLNRHSVSWAVAAGLFIAFTPPIPFAHTAAIAALAILFHFNLPIAIAVLWVNNPVTLSPIFYLTYKLGSVMLGRPPRHIVFQPTWDWFVSVLHWIWQPFLLGSITVSVISAILGYLLVQGIWRLHVVRDWNKRKRLRQDRSANSNLGRR